MIIIKTNTHTYVLCARHSSKSVLKSRMYRYCSPKSYNVWALSHAFYRWGKTARLRSVNTMVIKEFFKVAYLLSIEDKFKPLAVWVQSLYILTDYTVIKCPTQCLGYTAQNQIQVFVLLLSSTFKTVCDLSYKGAFILPLLIIISFKVMLQMTTFSKSEQNLPCTTHNFASKMEHQQTRTSICKFSRLSDTSKSWTDSLLGKNSQGFSREGKENGDWKKTVWIFGEIGEMCKAWKTFLKCIFCEKEQWLSNNISIWYSLSQERIMRIWDWENLNLAV